MSCIYVRTNSDLCHLQHKLIGFCNRDEKCLQRGTDWGFKYSGLRLGFKGLIQNHEKINARVLLDNVNHSVNKRAETGPVLFYGTL